jgi:hypothetical protein
MKYPTKTINPTASWGVLVKRTKRASSFAGLNNHSKQSQVF